MTTSSDRPDTAPGTRPAVATACGKAILLGEHSVVYGEPALAVPLPGLRLAVELAGEGANLSIALEPGAPDGAEASVSAALRAVASTLELPVPSPLRVAVRTGGLRSGMGTSAALGVAMARALLLWHGDQPDSERVLAAAQAVECLFHGNPSGVDHTVSALETPLWFIKGSDPEPLRGLAPLHLVLLPRQSAEPTAAIVGALRGRLAAEPGLMATVAQMGDVARASRAAWERGDLASLADGLTAQQAALERLGVVGDRDRDGVTAALAAGALAAKITGAGRNGSLLALVTESTSEAVRAAWGGSALAYTTG